MLGEPISEEDINDILLKAAVRGDLATMEQLLLHSSDTDAKEDTFGATAMMVSMISATNIGMHLSFWRGTLLTPLLPIQQSGTTDGVPLVSTERSLRATIGTNLGSSWRRSGRML